MADDVEMDFKKCAKKCSCKYSKTINDPSLKAILPVGYHYSLCEIKYVDAIFFESRIRIAISTKEDALKWLDEFMLLSNTIFKKSATFPEDTQSNIYRVKMRCHRNTRTISRATGKASKNTNCPSKLTLTVKRSCLSRKYESKDVHLKEFPTVLSLHHVHNHPIDPDTTDQYRQPSSNIKEKFLHMFECGFSPAKAISKHVEDLKNLYGDDAYIKDDPTLCPKKRWVYSLYTNFKKKPSASSQDEMLSSLQSFVSNYNQQQKGKCSELKIFKDGHFFIVIVTPLMKRVLVNIPETADFLFVDSIGNVDKNGCRVMFLLTNSACGELPVCCIVTTSERDDILASAFECFQSFLNENSFGGRGLLGPKVIMTGLRKSERSSLMKAFPVSFVLLCTFQVLQAAWRYVMSSHSGFPMDKHPELFLNIKNLVYAPTKSELKIRYDNIIESAVSNRYERYIDYLRKLYIRQEEWAVCFRQNLELHEQSESVACEASCKFLKDDVLKQCGINSVIPLFDFIISDLENFYKNKLVSISNSQKPNYLKITFNTEDLSIVCTNQIGPKSFLILNERSGFLFLVDLDAGLCSCKLGQTGAMCSHQYLALQSHSFGTDTLVTVSDPLMKKILFFVATGRNVPSRWFGNSNATEIVDFKDNSCELNSTIDYDVADIEQNVDCQDNGYKEEKCDISTSESNANNTSKEVHCDVKLEEIGDDTSCLQEDIFQLDGSDCDTEYFTPSTFQTIENLQMTFSSILNEVKGNNLLLQAAEDFVSNFKNIHSDNALAAALSSFGKCNTNNT